MFFNAGMRGFLNGVASVLVGGEGEGVVGVDGEVDLVIGSAKLISLF